jgi:hypothetical protein
LSIPFSFLCDYKNGQVGYTLLQRGSQPKRLASRPGHKLPPKPGNDYKTALFVWLYHERGVFEFSAQSYPVRKAIADIEVLWLKSGGTGVASVECTGVVAQKNQYGTSFAPVLRFLGG